MKPMYKSCSDFDEHADAGYLHRTLYAKSQKDDEMNSEQTLLEVPPLPVTPPVTPGRAEIPSLICAVR